MVMAEKALYDIKSIAPGIIGALILLYGTQQSPPQLYYILGSTLLLLTAIHYKLLYFIALELILVTGHSAILLGIGSYTQAILPLVLCLQLLFFYLVAGKENNPFLFIGIIGIGLLSLGFAYNHQWVFFSGGSCVAIYAYYNGYRGRRISYLWAILNSIFAIMALYQLLL